MPVERSLVRLPIRVLLAIRVASLLATGRTCQKLARVPAGLLLALQRLTFTVKHAASAPLAVSG